MTFSVESQSTGFELRLRQLRQGTGIVVVNLNEEIWVQRDRESRPETGRVAGLPSVIFESKKPGETQRDNVLGGLAELINDVSVKEVSKNLLTTDKLQSTPILVFEKENKVIEYQVAVLVFDGVRDKKFEPFDRETEPIGWMTVDRFLEQEVRPLAQHAVVYLRDEKLLKKKIEEYHEGKGVPVVDQGFSVELFYKEREGQEDKVLYLLK